MGKIILTSQGLARRVPQSASDNLQLKNANKVRKYAVSGLFL